MTTLSPTQTRSNLSSLLKRAAKGEDIGILHGDQVIALRPVTVHSDDYALQEYGVTEAELDAFVRRTKQRIARHRKAGRTTLFSGDIEADIAPGASSFAAGMVAFLHSRPFSTKAGV